MRPNWNSGPISNWGRNSVTQDNLMVRNRSGIWQASTFTNNQGSFTPGANRVHYTPYVATGQWSIDAIAMQVTSGGAAGAVFRLGIYLADQNFLPGQLLVDGTVDSTTNGVKVLTFTPVIVNGPFFVAGVCQVNTCTIAAWQWDKQYWYYDDGASTPTGGIKYDGVTFYTDSITGALASNPSITQDLTMRLRLPGAMVRFR